MRNRRTRRKLIVLILATMMAGIAYVGMAMRQDPEAYFRDAVKNAQIEEAVSVGGKTYTVAGASVTTDGGEVLGEEALSALSLAYAVTLAKRSPLVALPGTDPDALDTEVNELRRVQLLFAGDQARESDSEAIANALYPIDFLHALAGAERARRTFIASGSDQDRETYEQAVDAAIAAHKKDAALFVQARKKFGARNVALQTFGGIQDDETIDAALDVLENSASRLGSESRERQDCLAGKVRKCNPEDLAFPLPDIPHVPDVDIERVRAATEVYNALGFSGNPSPPVALATSGCVAIVEPPYVFRLTDTELGFRYVGDIFFSTSTRPIRTLTRGRVNASVESFTQTTYYRCPELGRDLSRIRTVIDVADFAKMRPSLAPAQAAPLFAEVIKESDAMAYVSAAFSADDVSRSDKDALLGLALTFKTNSSGLDRVLTQMRELAEGHRGLAQTGFPFDLGVKTLFSTHTVFPSVFQIYNPSVTAEYKGLYKSGTLKELKPGIQLYSEYPEYRLAIIDFWKQYSAFEKLRNAPALFGTRARIVNEGLLGAKLYENAQYHIAFEYPEGLAIVETHEEGRSFTVLTQDADASKYLKIRIIAFSGAQIPLSQVLLDAGQPLDQPQEVVLANGVRALIFLSENPQGKQERNVWFIRDGFLYEASAPSGLDAWLSEMLSTLRFI